MSYRIPPATKIEIERTLREVDVFLWEHAKSTGYRAWRVPCVMVTSASPLMRELDVWREAGNTGWRYQLAGKWRPAPRSARDEELLEAADVLNYYKEVE